jgi:hypothetical protein
MRLLLILLNFFSRSRRKKTISSECIFFLVVSKQGLSVVSAMFKRNDTGLGFSRNAPTSIILNEHLFTSPFNLLNIIKRTRFPWENFKLQIKIKKCTFQSFNYQPRFNKLWLLSWFRVTKDLNFFFEMGKFAWNSRFPR